MSHPAVQVCADATADAARRGLEIDARLTASDPEVTELLSTSRAAIARSRDILKALRCGGPVRMLQSPPYVVFRLKMSASRPI